MICSCASGFNEFIKASFQNVDLLQHNCGHVCFIACHCHLVCLNSQQCTGMCSCSGLLLWYVITLPGIRVNMNIQYFLDAKGKTFPF